MRSPAVRLAAAFVCSLSLFAAPRPGYAASVPSGFIDAVVVSGLSAPTAMALVPDGRVFIAEQGGAIRVVKAGVLLPTPFVTLTVDSAGERGAIGVAIDPQFDTNGFVYVHYTVPGTGGGAPHNRVSRFTASGDVAVPGSQFVVVDLDALSSATNHNGGAIHFGPDGKLYIGVGENANGANAQTLTNRKGKVLRLNKDGSIPTDNPFFGTATGVNRAIWALGLRNPFTFAFEAGTTRLYINDVGQSTWEEIDLGVAGSNYGWPTTEGVTANPSFRSPLYVYGHGSGAMLGCAIAGGAFGRVGASFPASFAGDYFFADLCGGWINRRTSAGVVSTFASDIPTPVDLFTAPDGALFYLARGSGGTTGFLGRITGPTGALVGIDPTAATVTQPITVKGFAIDPSSATGTGIDAIQVWAYPNPGSGQPAVFVAAATYGLTRPEIGARFGARFAPSGYSFPLRGLRPGPFLLVVFARSTMSGTYTPQTRMITVRADPLIALDVPSAGAAVREPFLLGGWAIDRAGTGTGVDGVSVQAIPVGGGTPVALGPAVYGVQRSDVSAAFGGAFLESGYQMLVRGLTPGPWRLVVSAHSTVSGGVQSKSVTVQVLSSAIMFVDTPRPGATVTSGFTVSGWAIDAAALSGTGVDAVHVWAYPAAGGSPVFLGANAVWVSRPDVGAIFGGAFTPSGFNVATSALGPGSWNLVVFARSTATGTFSQSVLVPIHVP